MALTAAGLVAVYRTVFLHREWIEWPYSFGLAAGALGYMLLARRGRQEEPVARWPRRVRRPAAVSIAVSTLLFALCGLVAVHGMRPRTIPYYDQEAYIAGAMAVRGCGGPWAAVAKCFVGGFPESNREPLALLILSPFARGELELFEAGKHVTLLWGVLAVASAGFVGWRIFGPAAGVVAAFGLSMNHFTLQHSALVSSESLFVLATVWSAYFVVVGLKRRWLWPLGGMLAGLAYLSKAPGMLLCGAFAAAAAASLRWSALREKHCYLFVAGFVLVCLPFFVDGMLKYGSPIHTPKSSYMWADSWDEVAAMTPEQHRQLSLASYARTHTFAQAWRRMYMGLWYVRGCFVSTSELRVLLVKYASGVPIALLALIGLVLDRDTFRRTFFLALLALFSVLLAWHSAINLSERHVLALLPFLFCYFGQFLADVLGAAGMSPPAAARRVALVHLFAGVAGIVCMLALKGHRLLDVLPK